MEGSIWNKGGWKVLAGIGGKIDVLVGVRGKESIQTKLDSVGRKRRSLNRLHRRWLSKLTRGPGQVKNL